MNEQSKINDRQSVSSVSMDDNKAIHLKRGSEEVVEEYDLVWPQIAIDEFESAKRTLVEQLRSQIKLLAHSRGSRIATDVEVRDVLRQIVVGRRQTVIIRISRIVTVFAVLAGGVVLNKGWADKDPLLTGVGVGLAIVLTAFQELMLHFRR